MTRINTNPASQRIAVANLRTDALVKKLKSGELTLEDLEKRSKDPTLEQPKTVADLLSEATAPFKVSGW